jgi:hypothetical protein
MTPLPTVFHLLHRPWRWAVVLSAWLLVSGCGPGVGGTGTGQQHSAADFGAVTAPLCTSSLADRLNCPPPVGGASTAVGSLPVLLADATPPQRASGRIDGSLIELTWFCEGWSFHGEWGVAARDPGGRFYGTGRGPAGRVQPAVLSLQPLGGGGFHATLLDTTDQALLPPVLLQAVPSLGVPLACSS